MALGDQGSEDAWPAGDDPHEARRHLHERLVLIDFRSKQHELRHVHPTHGGKGFDPRCS